MAGRVVKVKRILTPSLPKFRALHPLKSSASPAGIAYVLVVGALFSYWLILIAFVLYLDFFFFKTKGWKTSFHAIYIQIIIHF